MSIRLEIKTIDRVGMALDVLKILYIYGVNLMALEVNPGVVYVKMDENFSTTLEVLTSRLLEEPDVMEVNKIRLLPQEKREKQTKAVLDAAGEGIIAVDREARITSFNPAAEKILKLTSQEALGQNIADLLSSDIPIIKTAVTGEEYSNEEMTINIGDTKSHYITSGRPILDEEGHPVGAVACLQDMESVMELVHLLTAQPMITFDEIIGESESINRVKDMARIVAKSDSTVLIRGDSGTGKELFARSIHMASPRYDKPFVPVNCAALPDTLLESELFGYEEGTFTGARKGGKQGLFKYADKGTIFLDEIGELSTHLQVKLLRVLQEWKIRKIGGDEELPIDVRVIAATNRDLEDLMREGRFREDLYYRLNVFPLWIPPLRDRMEDIPILADNFIRKLAHKMNKSVKGLTPEAQEKLMAYDWPGNIRELSNVIERGMNLCHDVIEPEHIILKQEELRDPIVIDREDETEQRKLKEVVAQAEKVAIKNALNKHKSIRQAARALGVTHVTILNKMKIYNLQQD